MQFTPTRINNSGFFLLSHCGNEIKYKLLIGYKHVGGQGQTLSYTVGTLV